MTDAVLPQGSMPPLAMVGAGPGTRVTGADAVASCCSALYGSPLAELLVGTSFHPGGLDGTRRLLAASRLPPGARLLDAGCGLGASSTLAATEFGLEVEGVDASGEVIRRAQARDAGERVRWTQADLLELPHREGSFDGVLVECVLSTLPREAALPEVRRVLHPGGRILLSDVETGGTPIPSLAAHGLLGAALCVTDAWREGEVAARLDAAGFVVERRWDRADAILDLVDRIEARARLASVVTRQWGLDLAALAGSAGLGNLGASGSGRARELADEVRAAVRRGALGYFALIARARG